MDNPSIKQTVSVFAFFILLLLAWLVVGAIGFYRAVVSYNWPVTQGTVVSAEVVRPAGKSTKYVAEIGYTYQVGGKEFFSKSFKATSARGTSSWARQLVGGYPAGTRVAVHYNPEKPGDSVVEPGLQSDNYWMTLAPLAAIVLLLLALFQQVKNKNKPADGLLKTSP
jgi:hypothetical protein